MFGLIDTTETSLAVIARDLRNRKNPVTCIHISNGTAIDRNGFQEFIKVISELATHEKESPLAAIGAMELEPSALQKLLRLTIVDDQCSWLQFSNCVSNLKHLERFEILSGSSSHFIFEHRLEDLLLVVTELPNFKCLKVHSRIIFGSMEEGRLGNILDKVERIDELTITNLSLDVSTRDITKKMTLLLSKLCSRTFRLGKLHLEQSCFSMQRPIDEDGLRRIFRSNSLRYVALRNMGLTTPQFLLIAEELSRNVVLESIDIRGDGCNSAEGYYSLLSTMQTQYYVKEFKTFCPMELEFIEESSWPETEKKKEYATMIESFASLNAAHRRRIIRDEKMCHEDWVSLMILVRKDTNALFSLLVSNPRVCECRTTATF